MDSIQATWRRQTSLRDETIEEIKNAEGMTLISVPTDLVPEIRSLIARKQTASPGAAAESP